MYPCQNQQALLADETMLTPNKNTPDPSIWAKSSALHQRALSEREILSRHLWGGGGEGLPVPPAGYGELSPGCQGAASHSVIAVGSQAVSYGHLSLLLLE